MISISQIPPQEISKQIEFTSKDIKPDVIKIGMLYSTAVINSVLKSLKKIKVKKIILDPVMIAKGGTKLIDDQSIKLLKSKLIKKVSLITPNIPEAEILTRKKINNLQDMINSAKVLINLGAKNVLIKGGHLKSKIIYDVFINKKYQYSKIKKFSQKIHMVQVVHFQCYCYLLFMWKNVKEIL